MLDDSMGLGGTCFPFSSALMALLKVMTLGVRSLAETNVMVGCDEDDDDDGDDDDDDDDYYYYYYHYYS